MAKPNLSAQRLRELLAYDPIKGEFRWRIGRKGAPMGALAGGKTSHGYINIGVDRTGQHYAHRLAWLYMNGEWPTCEIDHINGNRTDNRWSNLRGVSSTVNKQNKRRPQSNNKSGFLGVSLKSSRKTGPRKWLAQIALPGGKRKAIGTFKTPEEAHEAYLKAKRLLHEGCSI